MGGGRGEGRAAALHVALISVLRRVARFGQCVQARGGSSKSRPRFQSKGELAGRAYRQGGEADEGAGGGGECLAVALRLYAPTLSASVVVWLAQAMVGMRRVGGAVRMNESLGRQGWLVHLPTALQSQRCCRQLR